MLSYQHLYHAGGRADIHKHDILARALEVLIKDKSPITYFETHAGRGVYDLTAPEARKTGEAEDGWLRTATDGNAIASLSKAYIASIRALNEGKLSPRYPGSPKVAASILRENDALRFMELHPAEYEVLKETFKGDTRAQIHKRDGLEAALTIEIPHGRRAVFVVDPSFEIKSEYETIPDFIAALHRKHPKAIIFIWAPMLPAKRHEILLQKIRKLLPAVSVSESAWAKPEDGRGMYGSLMLGINAAPLGLASFKAA